MAHPFRASHPALQEQAFQARTAREAGISQGMPNLAGMLLLFPVATSAWTPKATIPWMGSLFGGLARRVDIPRPLAKSCRR